MDMEIRRASADDLPDILALVKQYPDVLVQDHLPEAKEFFVAEENGQIVGCCALEVYSQRLAEIRSLAVAKEHHGKGIGTELIEACLEAAKEKGVYEVISITSAVPLFEKHGFGTFKNEKYALIKVLGSNSNT
jgi:amino-acid N-acetyltransferase